MRLPRWFVLAVGLVATAVWVADFIAGMVRDGYTSSAVVGYIMMAVVSACFASDAIGTVAEKIRNGNKGEDK